MHPRVVLGVALSAQVLASLALADEQQKVSDQAAGQVNVGLGLQVMTAGTLRAAATGPGGAFTDSAEADDATGLSASIDYFLTRHLAVGLSPRLIFNVKEKNDTDAAKQLDLLARLSWVQPVSTSLHLFAQVNPGYSVILMPQAFRNNFPGLESNDPRGFILDFGVGMQFSLSPNAYVGFDVGYLVGFQTMTLKGPGGSLDVDLRTDYLRLGALLGVKFGAESSSPRPQPLPPVGARSSVEFAVEPASAVFSSTHAPGRRRCSAVMVLPAPGLETNSASVLSVLEGHLLARNIRVVSSAITGRAVIQSPLAPDSTKPTTGAAILSDLERALVLAKNANVDCVLQLFTLDVGTTDATRLFVWPMNGRSLVESDQKTFETYNPGRRWTLVGPRWQINSKLIDVDSGNVLAVIGFSQSTAHLVQRRFELSALGDALVPADGTTGWRIASTQDVDGLRSFMMSELSAEILGPK